MEPLSPRMTPRNVDLDTGSRVRRLLAGRQPASSPTVPIIQTERAGKETGSVFLASPSLLSCLSIKPFPSQVLHQPLSDPSLWLVKIYSVEGIWHGDALSQGDREEDIGPSLMLCPAGQYGDCFQFL